jgi:hypothetical protein
MMLGAASTIPDGHLSKGPKRTHSVPSVKVQRRGRALAWRPRADWARSQMTAQTGVARSEAAQDRVRWARWNAAL